MDLDTFIKKLQNLRAQGGNLDVFYLVHSDSEQYPADDVKIVPADGAIEEKIGIPEGNPYILIESSSVW